MKTKKTIILAIGFILCTCSVFAQQTDTLREEISFTNNTSDNHLIVNNVSGFVTVEGYNGTTVQVKAERIFTGKRGGSLSSSSLEIAKSEVSLKVEKRGDTIYAYLDSPYSEMNYEKGEFRHNESNVKRDYRYTLHITIKVPSSTNLKLRAINNGDITVSNMNGEILDVSNINGAISLENVSGAIKANALNKNIDVLYSQNPTQASDFNSLNGDINIVVPSDLHANVSFKSLNGDLYTNFATQPMATHVEVSQKKSSKRKGTTYKLNNASKTKFGNGGVVLSFNVLNGDVTIKK